jgi:hypothetical protein
LAAAQIRYAQTMQPLNFVHRKGREERKDFVFLPVFQFFVLKQGAGIQFEGGFFITNYSHSMQLF